jgi:ABC-2 type transport system permease protein
MRRLLAVMHARNLEFLRDRATLAWNIFLPVALVVALAIIFGGPERPLFKVSVLHEGKTIETRAHPFLGTHYVEFVSSRDQADAVRKVARHQLDLLLDVRATPPRYWVNTDSPKGYIVEKLLLESNQATANAPALIREPVSGDAVRYVDWLLPGILGMNIMFSCLFGVGWVVVRYRKSGFLKRLRATPLRAIEFIAAQVLSRLVLIMLVTVFVFVGLRAILDFPLEGSGLLLFLVALLGAIALISIGLFVAARFTSEELAGGIINVITWPMMLLSGVWFSLEGSADWVRWLAQLFPLTQMLDASRAIMLDGAGFLDVAPELAALAFTAALFLVLGAVFFKWRVE